MCLWGFLRGDHHKSPSWEVSLPFPATLPSALSVALGSWLLTGLQLALLLLVAVKSGHSQVAGKAEKLYLNCLDGIETNQVEKFVKCILL